MLVAALCVLAAQWVMHAKRPPPRPASFAEAAPPDEALGRDAAAAADKPAACSDSSTRWRVAAALRDAGVSWDRRAKAALVDGALSCFVVAASVLSVANALPWTSRAARGGRLLGVALIRRPVRRELHLRMLIFVTQPFKAGDLVATAHAAGEGAFRGVVKQVGGTAHRWRAARMGAC